MTHTFTFKGTTITLTKEQMAFFYDNVDNLGTDTTIRLLNLGIDPSKILDSPDFFVSIERETDEQLKLVYDLILDMELNHLTAAEYFINEINNSLFTEAMSVISHLYISFLLFDASSLLRLLEGEITKDRIITFYSGDLVPITVSLGTLLSFRIGA